MKYYIWFERLSGPGDDSCSNYVGQGCCLCLNAFVTLYQSWNIWLLITRFWSNANTVSDQPDPIFHTHTHTFPSLGHWSCSDFNFLTSEAHSWHEAPLQTTRGAIFTPQLVDGTVVPAGTQVVLLTWRQKKVLRHKRASSTMPPLPLIATICGCFADNK